MVIPQEFSLPFNPAPPTVMHIDLNSCFATIEQQANPLLRGKPVAVCAYTSPNGCILTASYEAKRRGVQTGMRVRDGQALCPDLVLLQPDPEKYRFINRQLLTLLRSYTSCIEVESIDEMVMTFEHTPILEHSLLNHGATHSTMLGGDHNTTLQALITIARQIKRRIRSEIGEWLTVSIGISTNRYLAKVASGLQKPDGLRYLTAGNIQQELGNMALQDLCGIKEGNSKRLMSVGIASPLALYRANPLQIKKGLRSIVGYQWWLRLHGWEDGAKYKKISDRDDPPQKTYGQSHAFGIPFTPRDNGLHQTLYQLVAKMGRRMRSHHCTARGFGIYCSFRDYTYFHHGTCFAQPMWADRDFYQVGQKILRNAPTKPVHTLAVFSYDLATNLYRQTQMYTDDIRKESLTQAVDTIHARWGSGVITSARTLASPQSVKDRIAFGKAKDIETPSFREMIEYQSESSEYE